MLSLKLAWRNIFRNIRRTLLTVALIAFSLAALIITDGAVIGMAEVMTGSITHTLEGEAQVNRREFLQNLDSDLYIAEPEQLLQTIEQDASVAGFAPRAMTGGMITSTYNVSGGLIYGVDPDRELGVSRIRDALVSGEYLSGDPRQILMGQPMAELLEVELGDRIVLTVSEVDTGEISQELFRLSGIFEFGPTEMDENLVFIHLGAARKMLRMDKGLHQIAIRFKDPADARSDLPLLQSISNDSIEAQGWRDFNPSIGAMIEMSNYATLIVGVILFFLASLGVINSMFMSIYERIYEFGVAKAIGTTPMQLIKLVMLEAMLLAILSCITGDIMGYFANSYFATHGIPMGEMEFSGVVFDGLYTRLALDQFLVFPVYITLLTLVSAVYPAVFAARITPSEALHRSL